MATELSVNVSAMNSASIVTGIPVNSLYPDRYGIAKTKLYEILKQLQITTYRDGKTACITIEQLHQLDLHLIHGEPASNPVNTFTETSAQPFTGTETPQKEAIVPVELSALPPALQLIVEAISLRLATAPVDPLLPQRQLQELCDRGWLASTSQLVKILGIRPHAQKPRYGFTFQPAGKMGRESCWRVLRH